MHVWTFSTPDVRLRGAIGHYRQKLNVTQSGATFQITSRQGRLLYRRPMGMWSLLFLLSPTFPVKEPLLIRTGLA